MGHRKLNPQKDGCSAYSTGIDSSYIQHPVHTNSVLLSMLLKTELPRLYAPAFSGLHSIVPDKARLLTSDIVP